MGWPARKWVRWLLAGFAILLLAVIAFATWLVTTEAGLTRTVALAESLGSVSIRVEGASGRLIGPLHIATITIEHSRASIRIAGLEADYEPLEILGGRISAEDVRIADAKVVLHAATGPPKPPSFMPGWLRVVLTDAAVARLVIVSPGGTEVRFDDIRGSATIAKSRIEFDGVHVKSPGWAVAGASGRLIARQPLALDVTTAWSLSAENRVAGIAHAAGDLDRLLVEAQVAAPGIAHVRAEVRDLGPDLTFLGEAAVEKLDLAQWMADPPLGPLRGTLAIEGDRSHYGAKGKLHGPGLPEPGVGLDARMSYAGQVLAFESIVLESGPGSVVRAHGTLAVANELSYDMTADWTGFRWPLVGRALLTSSRGQLAADGWTEFHYRLSGDFQAAGAPPFSGQAAGDFTTRAIVVDDSDWQALGGRVAIKGSLGRDPAQPWAVSGHATDINPSRIRAELPGRLSFDFAGAGAGFDAKGPWSVSVHRLSGMFRGQRASGGGSVSRKADQTVFRDVAFALGPARLEANGILGRGANLDARLVSDDLSAFLPELGGQVDGKVTVHEHTVAVGFTGHDLAYGAHRAVVLSADAHIDRDGNENSWLRLRSNGITLAGFPITDTRLSLDGLPRDHAINFRIGSGADAVSVRGRGAWDAGRYTLSFEDIAASGPRVVPWRLQAATRLSASPTDAALEPLCLVFETRRFCFEGRWQSAGDWSVKATTEAFPLEALDSKRLGAPRFHGFLVFDAEASGHAGAPWIANVHAEIRDATLTYKSSNGSDRTVALGLTRATLVSDAGRHRLEVRLSDAEDLDLAVNLEALRQPGAAFGDMPLSGSVKGGTRQVGLLPLLVDEIDNASGSVALDFTVAGRLAAPSLEGEARLTQGSLDFYQANLRLRDLQSTVRLNATSLTLDAAGKAGEGSLAIKGGLRWQDRVLNGELHLNGDRLLVADVPEARVFASPDLQFKFADGRIDVTGDVVIPEARILPADTANAVLVSSDETILRPEDEGQAGAAFEVTSDVRLSLGKKVRISAYGLTGDVSGTVRTRAAPNEGTVASGELEVDDGVYRAYGKELEVERGRLLFTGGVITDPGVDLRATRELPGYKVGVIARGPLRRPQITLFSEPSLPQNQIASMLIVGRTSIQEDGDGSTELSPEEQGGALLAGQLGKYVGLDDVGLTRDQATGDQSLVLGKYLSPRLYVSYGISLVEEINTLKLRYTIGDRWTISAESGSETGMDVEYRIED
jgi:translocation and assembly module TamB